MIELGKYPLPKGWVWATIPELVGKNGVFIDGDWVESKDQDPKGGVRLIQLADVGDGVYRDKSSRFLTQEKANELGCTFLKLGDVLIARMPDPLGRACVFPGDDKPSVTVVDVAVVRSGRGEFDHRWLACFVNAHPFRSAISRLQAGSTRKRISRGNLATIPLPVPPLPDQRRIVGEIEKQFSRLEEGVGALKRVQANLKRYRAAVLKAACEGRLVTTEAERQRAKGRGKRGGGKYETGEELLARILAERRKNWQGRGKYKEPAAPDTSKLGKLPEGWVWASLGQICFKITDGTHHSPVNTPTGDFKYITSKNVREFRLLLDDVTYVDAATHKEIYSRCDVRQNDILYVKDGVNTGLAAKNTLNEQFSLLSSVGVFRAVPSVNPDYLVACLNSKATRDRMLSQVAGVAITRLTLSKLESSLVAIPPLAEQSRIVAEVERRLSVVEELEAAVEANLQRATRLRQSILQKAFEGKLVANGEAAPAAVGQSAKTVKSPRLQRHFARAILSAEIVHRLYQEPTFGRTKHQKIFHLCEYIAQIGEIQGQYHRDAAGPLDNKLIYANEDELKRQKWFETISRDGGKGHAYKPLEKAGEHRQYVERFWPDKLPGVGILIELMRAWKTEQCEIFCTTYAAWNDLILWGKEPTDDAILHEILECWHESKRRIPEERWKKAIEWMKKSGFAPSGFGQPTKKID